MGFTMMIFTDFIPLDKTGSAFDFLEFFLYKEIGDERIRGTQAKLKDFANESSPRGLIKSVSVQKIAIYTF